MAVMDVSTTSKGSVDLSLLGGGVLLPNWRQTVCYLLGITNFTKKVGAEMSIETGVLVGLDNKPIYWHLPEGRSAVYLPDSQDLWSEIWDNRDQVLGFAHSHPGSGIPSPSSIDIETFDSIEKALGRSLLWWICSETDIIVCRKIAGSWKSTPFSADFSWLDKLRTLSYTVRGWHTEYSPNWIILDNDKYAIDIHRYKEEASFYRAVTPGVRFKIANISLESTSNEEMIKEALDYFGNVLYPSVASVRMSILELGVVSDTLLIDQACRSVVRRLRESRDSDSCCATETEVAEYISNTSSLRRITLLKYIDNNMDPEEIDGSNMSTQISLLASVEPRLEEWAPRLFSHYSLGKA